MIRAVLRDNWFIERVRGDYYFMRHRLRGMVKVPYHNCDLTPGVMRDILKRSGYSVTDLKALL